MANKRTFFRFIRVNIQHYPHITMIAIMAVTALSVTSFSLLNSPSKGKINYTTFSIWQTHNAIESKRLPANKPK